MRGLSVFPSLYVFPWPTDRASPGKQPLPHLPLLPPLSILLTELPSSKGYPMIRQKSSVSFYNCTALHCICRWAPLNHSSWFTFALKFLHIYRQM